MLILTGKIPEITSQREAAVLHAREKLYIELRAACSVKADGRCLELAKRVCELGDFRDRQQLSHFAGWLRLGRSAS